MTHKLFVLLLIATIMFTIFVVAVHKLPYILGAAAVIGLIRLYRAYRNAPPTSPAGVAEL
jgi:hypothetical protein